MELTEPSLNTDLSIFIVTFYDVGRVFREGWSFSLNPDNSQINLIFLILFNIECKAGVLTEAGMINNVFFLVMRDLLLLNFFLMLYFIFVSLIRMFLSLFA